jgi:hypothetical protein
MIGTSCFKITFYLINLDILNDWGQMIGLKSLVLNFNRVHRLWVSFGLNRGYWNNGKMQEEWNDRRMEEWKNGRVE